MSLPASKRRYLAVAQALLTAIQQGRFEPGGRIPPDRELASRLNVSRPTVREALLALELVGAVTVRHGDGTYVSDLHRGFFDARGLEFGSDPRQVMEARITVEPPVSGLLTGHGDAPGLDGVQRGLDAAAELVGDLSALPRFVDLALRFHGDLAKMCTNRILNHVISQLVDIDRQPLWALLNQMVLASEQSRATAVEEHQRVLDAVRAGDPGVAEHAMWTHLRTNKRQLFLEDLLSEDGKDPRPSEG